MARSRKVTKAAELVGKDWPTPEEVTVAYPLGRTRLYALLRNGGIPSSRYGRTRFIRRADVEDFFKRHAKRTT